jgi:hypothetical protein
MKNTKFDTFKVKACCEKKLGKNLEKVVPLNLMDGLSLITRR